MVNVRIALPPFMRKSQLSAFPKFYGRREGRRYDHDFC